MFMSQLPITIEKNYDFSKQNIRKSMPERDHQEHKKKVILEIKTKNQR